jgi:flagellar P-ring protein precursor FlgI
MTRKENMRNALVSLSLALLLPACAWADRVKDLVSVASVRANQLIGYGIVVGLQGTGDGTDIAFTTQSMRQMLGRLGVNADGPLSDFEQSAAAAAKVDLKNAASVLVTAELPGLSRPGQRVDVNVSSLGRATSLRGGTLLMTSMRGIDGQVYALAQGSVNTTGVSESAAGSKVTIGVPTAARIPRGAIVEREVETPFERSDQVVLNLHEADFTTARAILDAINAKFGPDVARAIDSMSISVRAPDNLSQRVAFVSEIENLEVVPGDPPARVVVNARTGTVVISRNVRVNAAAVSHGSISVTVSATNTVSQPNAFAQGETKPVQNADIAVREGRNPMFLFQPGVDLRQIVDAVNQVGATPSALIAILEALKSSGSLRAELIVI